MRRSAITIGAARGLPLFALLAAFFLLAPQAAFGHAKLLRSEPKARARLPRPPKTVELWFSAELKTVFNTVEVKDAQGNRFDRGEVSLAEGGRKAQVELQDLAPGTYTVEWKFLSSDEHTLRGKFTFTVEAAAPAVPEATPQQQEPTAGASRQAPPAQPGSQVAVTTEDAAGEEGSALGAVDSLVRWLGYLAMMSLTGGFALWLFVLGPALREDRGGASGTAGGALGDASRRSVLLFRVNIAALVVSALAALVFQSSAVHGVNLAGALAPSRLWAVIAHTGFGRSWLVQAAGASILIVVVALLNRAVRRAPVSEHKGLLAAGLFASALLMLGPSLTGHAAAASKHYGLATLSDWLHLVGGGFWVGGLFHVALALPPALSALPRGRRAETLGRVIRLFTRVAAPAVSLILLSGLYNSWLQLGGWGALWGTGYGRTLLFKLLLVFAMLALGAVNNFHFGRRVKPHAGGAGKIVEDTGPGFARSLRVEAALGVLVLLATAFLVFTTPGRNHAAESPPASSERPAAAAGPR